MAIGRPKRHFETTARETIVGLCALGNGRWRITLEGPHKGRRFNERDERLAVQKFRSIIGQAPTVALPVASVSVEELTGEAASHGRDVFAASLDSAIDEAGNVAFTQRVDEARMWEWARGQIIADSANAAKRLGLPGIASLDFSAAPAPSLSLQFILDTYLAKSPAKDKSKREAANTFKRMMAYTKAKTLKDLTTDALKAWRDDVERSVDSPGTKVAYYGRVKTIIGFGLREALDAQQIGAALDRAKVLWTADRPRQVDPRPITREAFHTLLGAGDGSWRPWLLLGLNLCMHMDEVCELKWSEFDLAAATYTSIRGKTAERRIPRAATLWPETVKALKAVPRRGESPYVFVSSHGTRYNRNTRGNDFAELRDAAGLPAVTFDSLRDGAYTAACQAPGVDDKWARLLAGHKAPGLQDSYVLRNPKIVRPACDAVYTAYGPFD